VTAVCFSRLLLKIFHLLPISPKETTMLGLSFSKQLMARAATQINTLKFLMSHLDMMASVVLLLLTEQTFMTCPT
jgi:hypothetical protein